MRILVGTKDGLHEVGVGSREFDGHAVDALVVGDDGVWAIVDDEVVLRADVQAGGPANGWKEVARLDRLKARCLLPAGVRVLVGTSEAHLVEALTGSAVASFDQIPSRDEWYTPWGGPPDTRSLSVDGEGAVWVNVHVGGVWRAADLDGGWDEVVEVDADTHQVCCDPQTGTTIVAAAIGFGQTRDGGQTWDWATDGLHASYCRAVAFAGSTVLVTASAGPFAGQAGIYRRPREGGVPFVRCRDGLPEWFASNIDTGCLAASGSAVVCGTDEGEVYGSQDEGRSWTLLVSGLAPVRSVALA
ncbi:MAG: hypothetical protein ACRDYX_23645 [Egibacteraceae bacterium]